jgi:4,5-dihydroxyphthalate decarboxylase
MSINLRLTLSCGDYEITRPLKEGSVKAEGIDLTILTGPASRDRTWRIDRNGEVDVAEFNVCAYLMARSQGHPFVALPVFPHRRFRHGFVFINTTKGIASPQDLIGKRIGSNNFQPAACIWMRGLLEEYYGLPHKSVTWVTERDEDVKFTPAPDLRIERAPAGRTLDGMLAEGEIDALIAPSFPEPFVRGDKRVARLFPDYREVELRYYRETGIFPIMHTVTVRQEIVDQNPWVPGHLARAFEEAKQLAYRRVSNPRVVPLAWWSDAWEQQIEVLGSDPWRYGLGGANRKNLEAITGYCHRQGVIDRIRPVDELFIDVDEHTLKGSYGH